MDTKEEAMAVCTVGAFVLDGDEGGNHLLLASIEVAVREDQAFGQLHHVAQERRVRGEALEDSRNVGAPEAGPELGVEFCDFTGGLILLDYRKVSGWRSLAGPRVGDTLIFREAQSNLRFELE